MNFLPLRYKIRSLLAGLVLACCSIVFIGGGEASALPSDYRVLVLRVEFPFEEPDHETTSGRGLFDLRAADDPTVIADYDNRWDCPPHDRSYVEYHLSALNSYWHRVSDGTVTLTGQVWPRSDTSAYTMSEKFYRYGNGRTKEETYRKLAGLVKEALTKALAVEGAALDLESFDTVMIVHSGIGSETSGMLNDIPSAYLSAGDMQQYLGAPLTFGGKTVEHAIIVPEMTSAHGAAGLNGIMAQMFGFRLGLPSLSNNHKGLPAAGGWALMDVGAMAWGYRTLGFIPTHPNAWEKAQLGFIEPVTISADTALVIAATNHPGSLPRALKIPLTDDEYLLVENRFSPTPHDSLPPGIIFSGPDSTGIWLAVSDYDAFIPASGVLVWHINDRVIREGRLANTINDDPLRRGVDLLEADGREDIGALFTLGDERTDHSIGHEDDVYSLSGKSVLSPATRPDSGSLWGGASGITIRIHDNPGETVRISVTFTGRMPGFPVALGGRGTLTASDLNNDGVDELVATVNDSLRVIYADGNSAGIQLLEGNGHPGAGTDDYLNKQVLYLRTNNGTHEYLLDELGQLSRYQRTFLDFIGVVPHFRNPTAYTRVDGNVRLFTAYQFTDYPANEVKYNYLGNTQLPDTTRVDLFAVSPLEFAGVGIDGTLFIGIPSESPVITTYPTGQDTVLGLIMVDLNRDGQYEAVATGKHELVVVDADGKKTVITLPEDAVGSPAAGDIDGDGYPEIVQGIATGVIAYRAGGALVTGFPYHVPPGDASERVTSSPIIADLDDDGRLDIAIATSNRRMLAYTPDGLSTPGFPFLTQGVVSGTPCLFRRAAHDSIAIAYITDDGFLGAWNLGVTIEDGYAPWPMAFGGPALTSTLLNETITAPLVTTAPFEAFCYPNPVSGSKVTFRITPSAVTECTITVYTLDGRRVFETTLSESEILPGVANDIPVNSSEWASGLYIARIKTRQRTIQYKLGVLK